MARIQMCIRRVMAAVVPVALAVGILGAAYSTGDAAMAIEGYFHDD